MYIARDCRLWLTLYKIFKKGNLPFVYVIRPSQLSCLGSSVGKSVAYNVSVVGSNPTCCFIEDIVGSEAKVYIWGY